MDLAPYTALRAAVLSGVPLPFALDLDPGAVDQQMQRAVGTAVGDVYLQGLLAARQLAEVGHLPIKTDQTQQALDEPGRLAQRHPEQHFHRQAGLDGGVTVVRLAPELSSRRSVLGHRRIKPDRRRAAALERLAVGWPVAGLVERGCGSAHASQLPRWNHEMNPSRDLRNRGDAHDEPVAISMQYSRPSA